MLFKRKVITKIEFFRFIQKGKKCLPLGKLRVLIILHSKAHFDQRSSRKLHETELEP